MFNVFGLASFFHDLGKFTHMEFVKLAMSNSHIPIPLNMTNKLVPSKHFNLSPNYIFQLPNNETTITLQDLDSDTLQWSEI